MLFNYRKHMIIENIWRHDIVSSTLTDYVGSTSICLSTHSNCKWLVRCWSNVHSSTTLVQHDNGNIHLEFRRKVCVIDECHLLLMVAAIQYLNCMGCYNRLLKMRFNLISISSFFIDREGMKLEYSVMNTYNWYYYLTYYIYSNCFPSFVHDFLYHETVELFPGHRINCCLFQASLWYSSVYVIRMLFIKQHTPDFKVANKIIFVEFIK